MQSIGTLRFHNMGQDEKDHIEYSVIASKKRVQPIINHKLDTFDEQDNYCNYNSGRQAVFTTSNGNTATTPILKPCLI